MRHSGKTFEGKNSFWEDAYGYGIYLYAFLLPLRPNLKTGLFLLLLGAFLWQTARKKNFPFSIFHNNAYRTIIAYSLLCVLSLFYSLQQKDTLQFIVLQGSVLLLPLVVYRQLSAKQIQTTLLLFSHSCFILSVYATVITGFHYVEKVPVQFHSLGALDWTFFSYFTPQNIHFHAPYFSLYIGTCLIIHSYFLVKRTFSEHPKSFLVHLFAWLYFLSFLALLSSRTALVTTMLVLALAAVYLALKARKYLLLMAVVVFTVGASFLIFEKVPYLKTKFSQSAGVTERKMMWLSALDIIQEHPLAGVSPGDSRAALVESYRRNNFQEGVEARFDAHNQFLMFGVSLGLLGVSAFVLLLFFLLKAAYQKQNFILFAFVAVFTLCCLTESLLQRKDGTLLFSFIISLLLFAPKDRQVSGQSLEEQGALLKS